MNLNMEEQNTFIHNREVEFGTLFYFSSLLMLTSLSVTQVTMNRQLKAGMWTRGAFEFRGINLGDTSMVDLKP